MSAPSSTSSVGEIFEQAAKFFGSAMEAGIKIQEESAQSLKKMIQQMGTPTDWQGRSQAAMEEAISMAQKGMDEAVQLMNENAKTSLELLQKAFETPNGEPGEADIQTRTREMWETAVGSLRRNTEVLLQANTRVMDSWRELARIMRREISKN